MWLLAWRTAVIFWIVFAAIAVAVWLIHGPPSEDPFKRTAHPGLGVLWVFAAAGFSIAAYAWLVRAALRKKYEGFSLRLINCRE
jgi:hypothetical protein